MTREARANLAGRCLVLVLLSLAIGHRVYGDERHWHDAGKAAFLDAQSTRFDRSFVHPTPGKFFAFALMAVMGLTLYELLAFGAGTVLARTLPLDPKEK